MGEIFAPMVPLFIAFPIGLILFSLFGIIHLRRKRHRRRIARQYGAMFDAAERRAEVQR